MAGNRRTHRSKRRTRNHRKRGGSLRKSTKYLPYISKGLCDTETQIRRGEPNYPKSRAGKLRHSLVKRACYEKFPEYQANVGFVGPRLPTKYGYAEAQRNEAARIAALALAKKNAEQAKLNAQQAAINAQLADNGHYDPIAQKQSKEKRYAKWAQSQKALLGKRWRQLSKRDKGNKTKQTEPSKKDSSLVENLSLSNWFGK